MFKTVNGWTLNSDKIIAVAPPNHERNVSTITIYVQSGVGDGYDCPSIQISGTKKEMDQASQDIDRWLTGMLK